MGIVQFSLANYPTSPPPYLTLPNKCPRCKASISPQILYASRNRELFDSIDEFCGIATFGCPACYQPFVGEIRWAENPNKWITINTQPVHPEEKEFEPVIKALSPQFDKIYHQAQAAEAYCLDEVAGMGYRKALEFLIKDYCVQKHPDKAESIYETFLAKCIENYISHEKIKATAKAATWIGNDETHYTRKWDNKDISDLKKFLESCYLWIAADLHADEADDMINS